MNYFFSRIINRFIVMLFFIVLISNDCVAQPSKNDLIPIQGTFLQLWSAHGEWSYNEWEQLFQYFRKIKLTTLFVQWSLYDQIAFFPTQDYQTILKPPIEKLLHMAAQNNIRVFLGLVHDSQYWNNIRAEPQQIEQYLASNRQQIAKVSIQVAALFAKHQAFAGWYISQEIDDINWQTPVKFSLLLAHLSLVTQQLKKLSANKPIAISGFSNAATSPQDFGDFWKKLVQRTGIDIVMLQDGIGVNKLTLANLPVYFQALNLALRPLDCEFYGITETFSQLPSQSGFKAEPAPLEKIVQQLHLVSPYVTTIIAFSVPEYMTPLGGPKAKQLYEYYLQFLRH